MSEGSPLRLLVDGVFFQLASTGIARVWMSLLSRLVERDDIVVTLLDRGNCPAIPGVEIRPFPSYTMSYTAADSLLLQESCDEFAADVFTSTYYTSAITTPQVQMVYDMIPEVMGFDLSARAWKEKRLALSYAGHFACISANTRQDLLHFYPGIAPKRAIVAYCGVDRSVFNASAVDGLSAWRRKFAVEGDYVVFVGSREQHKSYKNAKLFFDAVQLDQTARFDIVCIGGEPVIDPHWSRDLPRGVRAIRLDLSDAELATAYSGAMALIYPSLYEGFGLPVIEAMASGCPVITTQHGSLGEVAGNAALIVSGHDRYELLRALHRVQIFDIRRGMIAAGYAHARTFDWGATTQLFYNLLKLAVAERRRGHTIDFHARWKRLRIAQAEVDVGLD